MGKVLIVTGNRNWTDKELVDQAIAGADADVVITGGARGADRPAKEVADARGIEVLVFKAEWGRYGRGAGMVNNRRLLDAALKRGPVLVLAFHDDLLNSKGTKNMVEIARKAGAEVRHYHHCSETQPSPMMDDHATASTWDLHAPVGFR